MKEPREKNLADVYKSCPEAMKIEIGNWEAVPIKWVDAETGRVRGPWWISKLGEDAYAEMSLSGKVGLVWLGSTEGVAPGWKETQAEKIEVLKDFIKQLLDNI